MGYTPLVVGDAVEVQVDGMMLRNVRLGHIATQHEPYWCFTDDKNTTICLVSFVSMRKSHRPNLPAYNE